MTERADPRVHVMVCLALQTGVLAKPAACEKCESQSFVEAHHDDYARPLDVRWLCRSCHRQEPRGINGRTDLRQRQVNLRVPEGLLAQIDNDAGPTPRNTWMTEAVEQLLDLEQRYGAGATPVVLNALRKGAHDGS